MDQPHSRWHSLKTKISLATLGIFLAGIWSLAFYARQVLHEDMERLLGEQQLSTVSMLAAQINSELELRFSVLQEVAAQSAPILLEGSAAMQAFIEQRQDLRALFNGDIVVFDRTGTVIADFPVAPGRRGANVITTDNVAAALEDGKSTVGRPVLGKNKHNPVFRMAVPVRDAQGRVVGAVGASVNLGLPSFLDQLTENPYGKTGGYLLIAPQHHLIVTSTGKKRILQPTLAPGIDPVIDRILEGREESAVHVNPLGVEMLSSAKRVPVANWIVVADLPTVEAFAPIRDMHRRVLLATVLLTIVAGGLIWWILRRQFAPLLLASKALARLSNGEPPQPLPIVRRDEIGQLIGGFNNLLKTLTQREVFLTQILDTSSVAIFLIDMNGRITQANRRMAEMFKCPLGALQGIEYVALVHPREREIGRQRMAYLLNNAASSVDLDRRYLRFDQTEFWGHLTGRRLHDANGEELGLVGVIADIDERKQAERALQESNRQYDNLVSKIPVGIYILRGMPQGAFALDYASPRMADILGVHVEDLRADAQVLIRAIHPEDAGRFVRQSQEGIESLRPFDWKGRVLVNGAVKWLHVTSTPEPIENGDVLWHGLIVDISERKQAEEKLHLAASVFTHAREGILITDADGVIIDVNDAFAGITGYARNEVLGQNPRILKSGHHGPEFYAAMWSDLLTKGHWSGEIWNRRKNGEMYAEMKTISAVSDEQGRIQQFVALFSDITPIKAHEKQLEHMAHYDVLTTLPNRVLLADRLHQAMAQAERRGQALAVAYLDLDGFKAINDSHGHKTGDQLLVALASRMRHTLRDGDTLARLGGDEFVAVLLDLENVAGSIPMLTRLLAAAAQSVEVDGRLLQVSASLGVTFYPQADDVDADQLLRQADQAMYQAKLAGKDRYHVFDADQDRSVRGHHESVEDVRRALLADEFVLYYQPKVNMCTGVVVGVEALIRWQHPDKGLLPPAAFLPVIENHPLAIAIGEWVIDSALTQIERWQAVGLDLPVSVNVGARQLQQVAFVERLRESLMAHPTVNPVNLEMEVLETSALKDLIRVSQVIKDCRELGVMFALDDFGTGYSSLTYLKRLPVSILKIDQSFVRDMLDDPDDLTILEGVISLAAAFHREVIAEGVETVEHGEMLLQLGCELAQGYGIARPMPAADVPAWVKVWKPDPAWRRRSAVNRDELPLLFAGVEHRAWIAAVEEHLRNADETPLPPDSEHCRFGAWLESEGLSRYGAHPVFQSVEAVHAQVHALASELFALRKIAGSADALARLGELQGLRDALLIQLKCLSQRNPE